jgi:FkbM family methyltransferase
MDQKLVHGWWLPKEDEYFEKYFSFTPKYENRSIYQFHQLNKCFEILKDKKDSAIDIGAHCGFWSFYLCGNFKKVFAFEPIEIFAKCFKKNVPHKNVNLFNVALGNENGHISMDINIINSGGTKVSKILNQKNKIKITKLDDYNFTNIDFIKIDVEGYEKKVILGAEQTILKNRPIIIIEQKGTYSKYYDEKRFDALDLLKKFGMKINERVVDDFILSW